MLTQLTYAFTTNAVDMCLMFCIFFVRCLHVYIFLKQSHLNIPLRCMIKQVTNSTSLLVQYGVRTIVTVRKLIHISIVIMKN